MQTTRIKTTLPSERKQFHPISLLPQDVRGKNEFHIFISNQGKRPMSTSNGIRKLIRVVNLRDGNP